LEGGSKSRKVVASFGREQLWGRWKALWRRKASIYRLGRWVYRPGKSEMEKN
jgi:hypothetical protein